MDQSLLGMLAVAPHSAEMHMIMGRQLGRQGDHANTPLLRRRVIPAWNAW